MNREPSSPNYAISDLVRYFLRLGTTGFGGPVALVSYMHRDLVVEKEWISEDEYKEGLALAQLAPGPLAAQLAIYLGYVHYGIAGATLAGFAFVVPSFLMVVGLGFTYVKLGGLPWIQAIFYGIGAAIIGIIAVGAYKLAKNNLGKDWLLWSIFLALALTTFIMKEENIWLILSGGLLYCLYKTKWTKPQHTHFFLFPFLLQVSQLGNPDPSLMKQIAWFFFKAGAFVFGSGMAIVPFLYGGVVKEHHWITEQQFLDAVAVAMITPGPIVITVGFIGYLVAGFPGACVAALATFLPCYLFTILPAPYFKRYGKHPAIKAVIEGITAAAIGAIAGAVFILVKTQIHNIFSGAMALAAIIVILKFKKIPEPIIIIAAAMIGLAVKFYLKA